MKLLSKATIYYLVITLIIFILAGIVVYFSLVSLIYEEVDELLEEQKKVLIEEIVASEGYESIILPNDSSIIISPTFTENHEMETEFSDVEVYSKLEDEFVPYRQLAFTYRYHDEIRQIFIRRSLFESDDLIETILLSLSTIFVIAILLFITVNYFGIRHLWHPFYQILENLKTFDFRYSNVPQKVESKISEFQQLESILNDMTTKMNKDYLALKEFSENASHEMQTPLAIIRNRLELLMQQIQGEKEMKSLDEVYQATNRLSKLHKALGLLTKLVNHEFKEQKSISLKPFLESQTKNFSDILAFKKISLKMSIEDDPQLTINEFLLEILFSNLMSNAIYHNIEEGNIYINLVRNKFEISNTGPTPDTDPNQYFERFKKGKPDSENSGLGLSIVKQICDSYGYDVQYTYENGMHILKVYF
jgi:signal transduction histidine kinase